MSNSDRVITDDALTAYLDGEADASLTAQIKAALAEDTALATRLETLSIDKTVLQDAFALDALTAPAYQPQPSTTQSTPRWAFPAAIAASFAAGLVIMAALRPAPTWVDTVASYQALYVTATLSGPTQSPAMAEAVLQEAEDLLGVDLRAATDVAGLQFKRAQVLAIEGEPLIQMAYLDQNGEPFAFCITSGDRATDVAGQMMSHGLATNAWVQDGVGYVLVGGTDLDVVSALSDVLQRQL
ncbi:MAG: hypothetical protein AAFP85_16155 [Pseudomonadota bacterium]